MLNTIRINRIPAKVGNAKVPTGTIEVRNINTRLRAATTPPKDTFTEVFISAPATAAITQTIRTHDTRADVTHGAACAAGRIIAGILVGATGVHIIKSRLELGVAGIHLVGALKIAVRLIGPPLAGENHAHQEIPFGITTALGNTVEQLHRVVQSTVHDILTHVGIGRPVVG